MVDIGIPQSILYRGTVLWVKIISLRTMSPRRAIANSRSRCESFLMKWFTPMPLYVEDKYCSCISLTFFFWQAREEDGKRPSQSVIDQMTYVLRPHSAFLRFTVSFSGLNMHAMRMGPGKHLQGRVLMNGLVKPEEFNYFHEVGCSTWSLVASYSISSS